MVSRYTMCEYEQKKISKNFIKFRFLVFPSKRFLEISVHNLIYTPKYILVSQIFFLIYFEFGKSSVSNATFAKSKITVSITHTHKRFYDLNDILNKIELYYNVTCGIKRKVKPPLQCKQRNITTHEAIKPVPMWQKWGLPRLYLPQVYCCVLLFLLSLGVGRSRSTTSGCGQKGRPQIAPVTGSLSLPFSFSDYLDSVFYVFF